MSDNRPHIFRIDLWDGIKEITPKVGDSVVDLLGGGYKVILPDGTCVSGNTGKLIKNPTNHNVAVIYEIPDKDKEVL